MSDDTHKYKTPNQMPMAFSSSAKAVFTCFYHGNFVDGEQFGKKPGESVDGKTFLHILCDSCELWMCVRVGGANQKIKS